MTGAKKKKKRPVLTPEQKEEKYLKYLENKARKQREEKEDIAWLEEVRKNPVEYRDCVSLWQAVLIQLAEDATLSKSTRSKRSFSREKKIYFREAKTYIQDEREMVNELCSISRVPQALFIREIETLNEGIS